MTVAVALIAFLIGIVIGIVITIHWINHRMTAHERALKAARAHRERTDLT
jgi:uncharacterized membrane-anchored protein YhcB (DUF1043 family)